MSITLFNWWFSIVWDGKIELHIQIGWASLLGLVIFSARKSLRMLRR